MSPNIGAVVTALMQLLMIDDDDDGMHKEWSNWLLILSLLLLLLNGQITSAAGRNHSLNTSSRSIRSPMADDDFDDA